MIAFIPEAQTLLTVVFGTDTGSPEKGKNLTDDLLNDNCEKLVFTSP